MDIWPFLAQYTGLSISELTCQPDPLVAPRYADDSFSFPTWNVEGKDPPSSDAIREALQNETSSTPPVPETVSRRQFFQQLAIDGDVTEDEALAAVTSGALPKKLADAVSTLPKTQQFAAKMLVGGAADFQRAHPMVAVLGAALRKDPEALDALWVAAFTL